MGGLAAQAPFLDLVLMNPAPGYMMVEQMLTYDDFVRLGPFSAVWFTSW
jgi:hypothetical protein